MTRRIFCSILLVTTIALFLAMGFLTAILFPYFDGRITNELVKELYYLSPGTEWGGADYLKAVDSQGNRITLFSPDGKVLFDSDADAESLGNHADREEFREAQAGRVGKSSRYSDTLGKKTLNCAIQLENGSILRLSSPQYTTLAVLLNLTQPSLIVIAVTAILAGFYAYRLSRKLTQPLNLIDLEAPNPAAAPYEELRPLLRRIHHQNQQINAQIMQLQSQQQQFAAITENMQEGLLVLDRMGRILSHNTSATRLLNVSSALPGTEASLLSEDKDYYAAVQQVLTGQHAETLFQVAGRVCHLFANPVFQKETVAGAVLVLLDVTEQHQREALRREFSANVSHELKTPLTSISGIAEIMSSGLMAPDDVPQFAGKIYSESQRLIKLVQDIIRISQLDENSVPHETQSVELLALIHTVVGRLEQTAAAQNIRFTVEGVPVRIMGVSSILDEMIFNLCENAIKYNRPGGSVTVRLEHRPQQAVLSVCDTGIGIPAEHQSRVFERFYRVDKSHSRAIGGTGLGLSIVKHGAAMHKAQLSLQSIPDRGTCIELIFPLEEIAERV